MDSDDHRRACRGGHAASINRVSSGNFEKGEQGWALSRALVYDLRRGARLRQAGMTWARSTESRRSEYGPRKKETAALTERERRFSASSSAAADEWGHGDDVRSGIGACSGSIVRVQRMRGGVAAP